MMTFINFIILFLSPLTLNAVTRPPQYISIAFDNCNEPEVWQQTRDFSKELKMENINAKFTFFLSGVFFVTPENKSAYKSPAFSPCESKCSGGSSDCNRKCHGTGSSAIGWANNLDYLKNRINQINGAIAEGHEIGSHAVSHWNGSSWNLAEWQSELDYFFKIISNPGQFNKAPNDFPKLNLGANDIVGFRAPYLEVNQNLYEVLKNHFLYDTSNSSDMSDWPQKNSYGTWIFPLGELPVRNRGRKVISMDYNFYYMQSKAKETSDQEKLNSFEDEMLDTYLNYFWTNYTGNRAPIHIGHHFTQYQKGVYWKALKRFTKEVCGKPEVRCITYKTLANELNKLSPDLIKSYQNAQFEKFSINGPTPFKKAGFEERKPATVSREELRKHTCPPPKS